MTESIADVAADLLCTSCGTCTLVCPEGAITMAETPAGLLQPTVSDACTSCGVCRKVCPGLHVTFDADLGPDPWMGHVRKAYLGRATDPAIRLGAQSGGLVSALLISLFETRVADVATSVTLPPDGSLRPVAGLVNDRDGVLRARGSKYCPVAVNSALSALEEGQRAAMVGTSCQIHGLSELCREYPQWSARIACVIGLCCDRTLLFTAVDAMARACHLDLKELKTVEYRSTWRRGWPGEVAFATRDGSWFYFPHSVRTAIKDFVTPPRCRLCFDKMNVLADLTVGDPWGVRDTPRGSSVVLVRTDRGEATLARALERGDIEIEEIDPALVREGQGLEARQASFTAFCEAWRRMSREVPSYQGVDELATADVDRIAYDKAAELLAFNVMVASASDRETALRPINARQRRAQVRSRAKRVLVHARDRLKSLGTR